MSSNKFVSPLDGNKVSREQFIKETEYLKEVDVMFSAMERNIFEPSDLINEAEATEELTDDMKYVQLYNNIIAAGVKTLLEEEMMWLKTYLEVNKKHWHDSNFQILRRI